MKESSSSSDNLAAEGLIASPASQSLDVNDGGSGEAAYCHHRHHFDEGHSSNFDTCPHSICVNARRVAEVSSPAQDRSSDIADRLGDALLNARTPQGSKKLAAAIVAYADWYGGVHDEGCPEDDTCDCSGKWINDGITAAVNYLRAEVSSPARPQLESFVPTPVSATAYLNVYIVRQKDPPRGDYSGLRGVHATQDLAEAEIASICQEHPDLQRCDFVVHVDRVRGIESSWAAQEQLMDRLENYYTFECLGGPLRNCVEWQQLKSLIWLAEGAVSAAPPALDALVARMRKYADHELLYRDAAVGKQILDWLADLARLRAPREENGKTTKP